MGGNESITQGSAERRRPCRPRFPNSLFPSWDSCFLSLKFAHQPQVRDAKRTSAKALSTQTRAPKIQNGEDEELCWRSEFFFKNYWTPTFGFVNQFTWLITYDSCRLWRNDYGIILLLRHHYVIVIIWIILRNILIILLTTTLDTAIYWFYESVYMTHTMSTMTQWLRNDFSIT